MATVSTRTLCLFYQKSIYLSIYLSSLRMPTAMLSMAMLTLAMTMHLSGIPMPMASFGVGGEFGQACGS
eukprot:scaffold129979_cov51-Phaeocystis_antarctica.AAC.4